MKKIVGNKIVGTTKELGIKFCEDCAHYSQKYCNTFKFSTDPDELTCPHFAPIEGFKKLVKELNNIAEDCGFRANFEYISEEQVNVYFTKMEEIKK